MLNIFRRRRRQDEETRLEFESHLEQLTERYVRQGMSPDAARAAARRQFGNVTWHREEIGLMRRSRWADAGRQDVRDALRQLRRSPWVSTLVVMTLALGIGGTTAVFSALHAVLLAPLPYADAGQLVRLYQEEPGKPDSRRGFSTPQFQMLRDEAASFSHVGARYFRDDLGLDLTRGGAPQRLRVLLVTADYFRTLAVEGLRGPGFAGADERNSVRADDRIGARRIVLSDAIWRNRFNGDPAAIGATIRVAGESIEVVGIAPPGFDDPLAGVVDAWLPYDVANDTFSQNYSLVAFGRLRPGAILSDATAELAVLSQAVARRWPDAAASGLVAVPLQQDITVTSRPLLQLLLIAVGLVLGVACANVANLLLLRASARAREFAIRASLGSGRARLVWQLMVESLVLAALGGVAGLGIAMIGVDALHAVGQSALPTLRRVGLDPIVLAFAASVTLATAVACGLAPAIRLANVDPNTVLGSHTRSITNSRRHQRVRNGLAAAQLALALSLLVGVGALSMSVYRLMAVDLGFDPARLLTFDVNLPDARYNAPQRAAFQEELAQRLAAIPGVTAAGGTSRLPGGGSFHTWPVIIETGPRAGTSVSRLDQPEHRVVSGEFFRTFGLPLLAGRTFDNRDDATAATRAVVSANFASLAFPGMPLEGVVGQRVAVLGRRNTRHIIGVVGDVAVDTYGLRRSAIYTAHRQFADNRNWMLSHAVATEGAPLDILPTVRTVVAAMDPEVVVHRPAAMSDLISQGASRERFALMLIATFAAVAIALAGVGLYGVLAYAVRLRTQEIGIRIALGATGWNVQALVLRQAAGVAAAGLAAGAALALGLGRWLSSLMFQVSPWDWRILTAAVVVLSIASAAAAWIPARRAMGVRPGSAMTS